VKAFYSVWSEECVSVLCYMLCKKQVVYLAASVTVCLSVCHSVRAKTVEHYNIVYLEQYTSLTSIR